MIGHYMMYFENNLFIIFLLFQLISFVIFGRLTRLKRVLFMSLCDSITQVTCTVLRKEVILTLLEDLLAVNICTQKLRKAD